MSITVTLDVPAISCEHCTRTIVRETQSLPGVQAVQADVAAKTATFTLDDADALARVRRTLSAIGYPAAD